MSKEVNVDEQTLSLINAVNKQKKEISKAERPQWKTNCLFSYTENPQNATNIHVEANIRNLVCFAAFLKEREKSYDEAAAELEVKAPAFTWGGFPVDEWLDDIKTRISKLQIASKKTNLEKLEARLNAIISPELKRKLELEAIASELNV